MQLNTSDGRLLLADPLRNRILSLQPDSDDWATLSGGLQGQARQGEGPALAGASALALDAEHGYAYTISGHKLLSIELASGNRSVVFDSAVGTGPTATQTVGSWVDPKGRHGLLFDAQPGRLFTLNLLDASKTEAHYTSALPAIQELRVERVWTGPAGELAIVAYRSLSPKQNNGYDHLELIELATGTSLQVWNSDEQNQWFKASFAEPSGKLLLTGKGPNGETQGYIYERSADGLVQATPQVIDLTALGDVRALTHAGEYLYALTLNETADAYALKRAALAALYGPAGDMIDASWDTLLTLERQGSGERLGVELQALRADKLLAVILPEQPTRFWNLTTDAEEALSLAGFSGGDQPRDYSPLRDFDDTLYYLSDAGLHICWFHFCSVLIN